ncbi:toxin RelE [Caloranaerobacter azorensis H53214]|uniref:Toxin RelE n=1 Tax=Caloranaerobacter azorensis H53214 TaxID=1156417 RepID=A0A096BEZ1_9FIRM|nr:toxin RelE [Caloranaerobacter azorensis]KGG79745.1 toxin RelE [Caloranaerobacter azorensis H53214]
MCWKVKFIKEAKKDLKNIDGSIRRIVLAGIYKVSRNPLPRSEGGYGKPLGHVKGKNLTNFFKIKYKNINIRVVYTLAREHKVMNIIVIEGRNDGKCYEIANKRKNKYGEDLFKDSFS